MRNTYRIKGNKAYITISAVNGRIPLPETEVVIDLKNLEKAQAYPGTWGQAVHQKTGQIYVRGRYLKDGKRQQPVLSRLLSGAKPGENTNHYDGDSLNCLEDNMVNTPICTQYISDFRPPFADTPVEPEKPQAQLEPVKGVSFHKSKRKWEVKPYYQGKRHNLGYWPEGQLAEANKAADYLRENGPEGYSQKYKGAQDYVRNSGNRR